MKKTKSFTFQTTDPKQIKRTLKFVKMRKGTLTTEDTPEGTIVTFTYPGIKIYESVYTGPEKVKNALTYITKNKGLYTMKEAPKGKLITACFPNKVLDILSPDGISILSGNDKDYFLTFAEGMRYFRRWKERYKDQGYYSSNYGRIDLEHLADECTVEEIFL